MKNTFRGMVKNLMEGQVCEAKDCSNWARVVVGLRHWDDAKGKFEYELMACCQSCADEIASKDKPKYVENCPNCGCEFGVA